MSERGDLRVLQRAETGHLHSSTVPPTIAAEPLAEFELEALPHMNDLFRTAVRLTLDQAKASDAIQETYLVAWKTFDRYERGTNCRAWLFQILFNVVRHERRKSFRWLMGKNEDVAAV